MSDVNFINKTENFDEQFKKKYEDGLKGQTVNEVLNQLSGSIPELSHEEQQEIGKAVAGERPMIIDVSESSQEDMITPTEMVMICPKCKSRIYYSLIKEEDVYDDPILELSEVLVRIHSINDYECEHCRQKSPNEWIFEKVGNYKQEQTIVAQHNKSDDLEQILQKALEIVRANKG